MSLTIIHQADTQRFTYTNESGCASLEYRLLEGSLVEACHTYVPVEMRGLGVADQLARAFYSWSQEQGLTIVPTCRYVERWLAQH